MADHGNAPSVEEFARVIRTVRAAADIAQAKSGTARALGNHAEAEAFAAQAREAEGRVDFLHVLETEWRTPEERRASPGQATDHPRMGRGQGA